MDASCDRLPLAQMNKSGPCDPLLFDFGSGDSIFRNRVEGHRNQSQDFALECNSRFIASVIPTHLPKNQTKKATTQTKRRAFINTP